MATPSMGTLNNVVRVSHREYLTDLSSVPGAPGAISVFGGLVFSINPGDALCFPWLSTIAQNFETYKFQSLAFEVRSLSGASTITTALGSIVAVAQYNVMNPPFMDKRSMENYDGSISSSPNKSLLIGVECDRQDLPLNHLYIRQRNMIVTADKRLYDAATFQVASVGCPNSPSVLGEVWVTYDVLLYQPKMLAFSGCASSYFAIPHIARGIQPSNWDFLSILGCDIGVPYSDWRKATALNYAYPIVSGGNLAIYLGSNQNPGNPNTVYFLDAGLSGQLVSVFVTYNGGAQAAGYYKAPSAVLTVANCAIPQYQAGSTQQIQEGVIRLNALDVGWFMNFYVSMPTIGILNPAGNRIIQASDFTSGLVNLNFTIDATFDTTVGNGWDMAIEFDVVNVV